MADYERATVLRAGRMLDGTGAPSREDVALLILDGRIAEIAHRDALEAPADAVVIDRGDETIMPGMVDAHMHFFGVASDNIGTLPTEREAYRALRAAGEAQKDAGGRHHRRQVPGLFRRAGPPPRHQRGPRTRPAAGRGRRVHLLQRRDLGSSQHPPRLGQVAGHAGRRHRGRAGDRPPPRAEGRQLDQGGSLQGSTWTTSITLGATTR